MLLVDGKVGLCTSTWCRLETQDLPVSWLSERSRAFLSPSLSRLGANTETQNKIKSPILNETGVWRQAPTDIRSYIGIITYDK
jgi:hypothetical protein